LPESISKLENLRWLELKNTKIKKEDLPEMLKNNKRW